mmetsp:Transcript_15747/g.25187  ORF Transcript_15747/g.25187 Transcript_15747/m.25187 type:complete len:98 (+) Transcript_15747:309-602(+)
MRWEEAAVLVWIGRRNFVSILRMKLREIVVSLGVLFLFQEARFLSLFSLSSPAVILDGHCSRSPTSFPLQLLLAVLTPPLSRQCRGQIGYRRRFRMG